ncbi:LysM peptidoglycan-binding domain-containing protein [Chitinibacteraceae bacterium HSL-7]
MKFRILAVSLAAAMSLAHAETPVVYSSEPADPMVEEYLFGDLNRARYDDLWERIRAGFAMNDLDSPLVEKWENYYASRPDYLNRIADRARRYLYHVVAEVEKRGMPTELALLPVIESAYNPKAVSSARAAGMWQFIPSTGTHYGLERTWWYDGRRDVVAATDAALDYLETLYGMFGDWELALASYNWGEGSVSRALGRNRAAGLPLTYSDIRKPDETANYVPKLLAIRNIVADPEAFGLTLNPLTNDPYFVAFKTGRHMDVQVAADLAGISVDELIALNPGFIRPVFAHKDERKLVIPAAKYDQFQRNMAEYDKPLLNWQPYVVQRGETFASLSDRFGIDQSELLEINDLNPGASAAGRTILVPLTPDVDLREKVAISAIQVNKAEEPVDTGERDAPREVPKASGRYRVKRGDTLFSIAQQFNMSVDDLKALNHMRGSQVRAGQQLRVSGTPAAEAPRREASRIYTVRKGDTLGEIAEKTGMSVSELKSLNGIRGNTVRQGQKLKVSGGSRADEKPQERRSASKPPKVHTVKKGDTLYSIAHRYDIPVDDLARWNKKALKPGMKVYLAPR